MHSVLPHLWIHSNTDTCHFQGQLWINLLQQNEVIYLKIKYKLKYGKRWKRKGKQGVEERVSRDVRGEK